MLIRGLKVTLLGSNGEGCFQTASPLRGPTTGCEAQTAASTDSKQGLAMMIAH